MGINKILSPWNLLTFFLIKLILKNVATLKGKYEKVLIYRYKTVDGFYTREGELTTYSQSLIILMSSLFLDMVIFLNSVFIILTFSTIRAIKYFES